MTTTRTHCLCLVKQIGRYHGTINNKYGQTLTRIPTERPKKRSNFKQTILSSDSKALSCYSFVSQNLYISQILFGLIQIE